MPIKKCEQKRKVLEIVILINDVHCHMDQDFCFTLTPYGSLLWGSTILPFSAAMGYHTVYRTSYSGMRQTQFAVTY